jgi:subtilisin-like proprotein convertase family protein
MYETQVMHPDLAAKYNGIKTYSGQGIDDPTASMVLSTTVFGVHAMVLSGTTSTLFIEPYTQDLNNYIVYSKDQLETKKEFSCAVLEDENSSKIGFKTASTNDQYRISDGKFRTYRMALACTIEYAAFHVNAANLSGGTTAQKKAAVLSAMVVTMARVNGIYQRDMALTMQLISNNDVLIFIDSDSFDNNNSNTLIGQSQSVITAAIGSANFDIGHTVSTGAGGVAGIRSVCVTNSKARGVTGTSSPVGDAFDVDYVAHEIGHQFGANHTFSGDQGACAGGNRSNSTAIEPGSGSTIMAYAGICGSNNIQRNSNDYFSTISIDEMTAHITSGSGNCVAGVANGNSAPVISALLTYTIPNGTPFKLTAPNVTDADGDVLTYCWEQKDAFVTGSSSTMPSATATTGANFRSFPPTTDTFRNFPRLSDGLENNLTSQWEVLPTVARTMNFTLTVRDNRTLSGGQAQKADMVPSLNSGTTFVSTPTGGQTAKASMVLTLASGTPFAVTSQNTDGITWIQGTTQTITWNVATTAVPASTTVNILLSTDGGLTYPTTLIANATNDGSQDIVVPNIAAPFCRIMIVPTNNIYYALNTKTFAIGYIVSCATYMSNTSFGIPEGSYSYKTITVPAGSGVVSKVTVFNKITHTYMGDVTSDISSPEDPSTFVALVNGPCGNKNGTLDLKIADFASAINCNATSQQTVAPTSPLSVFNGQNASGNWTLRVRDFGSGDTGTVDSWGIEVCTQTIVLANPNFGLSKFVLFPNPNKGSFTVSFDSKSSEEIKILVHDLRGRNLLERKYNNTGVFSQNIQLEGFQSGVYLVTVLDGDQKEVRRIIVE